MENQITPTVPTAASPIKKALIALTALLVVGGVGATVYLNMGTGQGDPNEPPPSLSVAGGGLKGSIVDESTQGFLKFTAEDITEFEKEKANLASKWGAAGTVKAGVNFYTINTDGLTMADLVKNYNPKVKDNRVLFVIYSAGQYMNGTTTLAKGFHTYPVGPFGAATNEIKKDDLSKINLPRNSGVIILSGQESENNGILEASIAPAGKLTGPLLPDDKSGWVLVSGNGKLADLLGAEKSRVISAWGLKNANEFEKVDLNTYTFSTYHVAWLNVGKKSTVTDTPAASPTPPGPLPTITKIEPATAEQGQKAVTFIITGTNLAGATVSFTPSTDFKNITGLTIDTTNTSVKFIADIDDNAKADEFKEIKLTTTAGSVSDKTKFKVTAKIAAPVGAITAKTSTDAPSAIVFTAPTEKKRFTADALKANGLSFAATDNNKTSYNKDASGKFYMNYAWKLTAATGGAAPIWSTGWTYDVAKITIPATCVATFVTTNPVAPYMTCPSGTIPKNFFEDIKSGDYVLAGTVGDGQNGKTTSVTITVIGVAPAGTITDKGSDTTLPAKFTFVSPTPDNNQVFDLNNTVTKGFDFTANDPNTKSHLKATDGKFYMSYAWELKKGNVVVWGSGWADNFATNPEGKTCVVDVTNPEKNQVRIWSCPSAVIPADKLKGIEAGTYTLTGWVGDGKGSPEPTSVTFKIEGAATATPAGAAAAAAVTSNEPGSVGFKPQFIAEYFAGEKSTNQWFEADITQSQTTNEYDIIYNGAVTKKDDIYVIALSDKPTEGYVDYNSVAQLEVPLGLEKDQLVVVKSPATQRYWNAKIMAVNTNGKYNIAYKDENYNSISEVESGRIFVPFSGKIKDESAAAPVANTDPSQEIIKAIQDKIDIKVTPYAISADTGNAMLRYTIDASKVDVEKIKTYGANGYFVKVKTFVNNTQVQPKFSTNPENTSQYYEQVSTMLYGNDKLPDEIAIYYDSTKNKTCAYWAAKGKTCTNMEPVVLPAASEKPNKGHLWFDATNLNDYQVRFDFYRDGTDKPVASYDRPFNLKADLSVTALTPATNGSSESDEFKTFYCNQDAAYSCKYPPDGTGYNQLTFNKPTQDFYLAAKQGYQGIKLMNKVTNNNYGIVLNPKDYTLKILGTYAGYSGLYPLMEIKGDALNTYSSNKESNGYVLNANKITCGTAPLCSSDPKTNINAALSVPGPGGTNYLFIPRDKMTTKNGVFGDITKVELVKGDKVISTFEK